MMCVCDKIDWMENGLMDWIEWMWKVDGKWLWKVDVESGEWKVDLKSGCECGKWRGSGSHTCRLQKGPSRQ